MTSEMLSSMGSPSASIQKPKKQIACQRCHARKVKCSGGHPCLNCKQSDDPTNCVYPSRDRQIKVSQSFIDNLIQENKELREANANSVEAHVSTSYPSTDVRVIGPEQDESVRNPLLTEKPWFLSMESIDMPIHIGEAADAAFATRFRQAIPGAPHRHIPRTDYASDEVIMNLADRSCPFPSPARARFLVKVSLQTICQCYHIVRRSHIQRGLEMVIKNPSACDGLFVGKLWALFAIGEMYSTKTKPTDGYYPGIAYYTESSKHLRDLSERPGIDTIELRLLCTLYSLCLNRRHFAYFLAGSAVRLGIVMGLHLNVPEFPQEDRYAREHRKRVWWTAYVFDRIWSSKMGQVVAVQDDDIEIDFPSNEGFMNTEEDDFGDAEYLITLIQLARLAGQVISSIYSRKAQRGLFSRRVQQALRDLTAWVEGLPGNLSLDPPQLSSVAQMPRISLHLSFNQCLILATRPVLLHIFRAYRDARINSMDEPNRETYGTALALAEACIRCARHSFRLLSESWIDGSFSTFDYFYTQYLFSSSTILAISSLMGDKNAQKDADDFDAATQFMAELRQNGNFAATEFCRHIEAIRISMQSVPWKAEVLGQLTDPASVVSSLNSNETAGTPYGKPFVTAGMALAEPSLQDFLAQPDFDFLGMAAWTEDLQGLYLPDLRSDNWQGV